MPKQSGFSSLLFPIFLAKLYVQAKIDFGNSENYPKLFRKIKIYAAKTKLPKIPGIGQRFYPP